MKKFFLLIIFAICLNTVYSQSQRLVFIEEFTQASCAPCAAANPAFNTLLSANTAKAVSIKYQTSWPGVDPMNAQNPTEVATRVTYYGVTGVPDAYQDGTAKGSPSGVTQAGINTEYAVPSPFTIDLKHWFNTANDSIYINCTVTASQITALTTGRLRIALIEKTINFTTAPGSNGETVFYNVMRKMYPNANGNVLESSWTNGQTKTFSFKAKLPTYIYSFPQLAVVAWIQDDATKNVKQAGFSPTASAPLALAPIADFSSNVVSSCDGFFNFYDLSALFPTSWQWDFGDGTTSNLKNPNHQYTASGTYPVQLIATNINGSNTILKTGYVTVSLSGNAPIGNNDNICMTGIANLSAIPSGSGTLNWYNSLGALVNTGTTYSPNITGTTNFWVAEMTANQIKSEGSADTALGAGASYTASATQGLYFDVIKPCTLQSVKVYAATAGNRTIQVVDANGTIVQTITVNIPIGMSTVNLNFALNAGVGYLLKPSTLACNLYRNTAGAVYPYNSSGVVSITGNSASMPTYYYFFYDWKVQQNPCASPSVLVSGIDSCFSNTFTNSYSQNSLNVFPNPNNGLFNIAFNAYQKDNYVIELINTLGQTVYSESLNNFNGEYLKSLNIETFGKGIYLLNVKGSKNNLHKKIVSY